MERPHLTEMQDALNFRQVDRSCFTCRYYRIHSTGSTTGECLLLGRTLSIGIEPRYADGHRVCNGWKVRPKTWNIHSQGVDNSPFWADPYISRESQERIAIRTFRAAVTGKRR